VDRQTALSGQSGSLSAISTTLDGVLILEPRVFTDDRGHFFESFNQRVFDETVGRACRFVQDNHSSSGQHVLRGLHYQLERPQAKIVRVTAGEIFDVAVDVRRSSPTLGRWVGVRLSRENGRQLWIPEGFAHGFLVLSAFADVVYKASDYYTPSAERTLRWDDPSVAIEWPTTAPVVPSHKDANGEWLTTVDLFP